MAYPIESNVSEGMDNGIDTNSSHGTITNKNTVQRLLDMPRDSPLRNVPSNVLLQPLHVDVNPVNRVASFKILLWQVNFNVPISPPFSLQFDQPMELGSGALYPGM